MRHSQAVRFPSAHEDDLEDVHWALCTATSLWRRGEDSEALRWLRRAAGVAADREADLRAVELFKAAADVASHLDARYAVRSPRRSPPPLPSSKPPPAPTPIPRPSPVPPAPVRLPVGAPPPIPSTQSDCSLNRSLNREGRPRTAACAPLMAQALPRVPRPHGSSWRDRAAPTSDAYERAKRLDYQVEDREDTVIRPDTALRRALMKIDPAYADRTDYYDTGWAEERDGSATSDQLDARDTRDTEHDIEPGDPNDTTQRKRKAAVPGAEEPMRVAVLPIPEEGEVRLLFLAPGVEPPEGIATAILVPPTPRDAELLAKVYTDTDAKL